MSSIPLPRPAASRGTGTSEWLRAAARGITRRQWAWALLVALVLTLLGAPQQFEQLHRAGWPLWPTLASATMPAMGTLMMFLAWRLADAGADARMARPLRLALALVIGGAVTTAGGIAMWSASGSEVLSSAMLQKGKAPPSPLLIFAAEYLNLLLVGGLIFAVIEAFRRRSATRRAFEAVARKQATLQHQVLQARLAAMQAQVEPRFLFDTLVGIEALYGREPQRAADQLDRLIAFLRAALPRLRESGSTVTAELDLVEAYLAVVRSLNGGAPTLTVNLAAECRDARFYPMLLLPLVQRTVRKSDGAPPAAVRIDVQCTGTQMVVDLHVSAGANCAEDGELASVRERLAGLYGARASLECRDVAPDITRLTLRLPGAPRVGRA
jgi:hypothetical protein